MRSCNDDNEWKSSRILEFFHLKHNNTNLSNNFLKNEELDVATGQRDDSCKAMRMAGLKKAYWSATYPRWTTIKHTALRSQYMSREPKFTQIARHNCMHLKNALPRKSHAFILRNSPGPWPQRRLHSPKGGPHIWENRWTWHASAQDDHSVLRMLAHRKKQTGNQKIASSGTQWGSNRWRDT